MTLSVVTLTGLPYEGGRQYGEQIAHLRPLLAEMMATRLAALRRLDADRPDRLLPAVEALEALDRPLLDFLAGLGTALEFGADDLIRYTLSSYLLDRAKVTGATLDVSVADLPMLPALIDAAAFETGPDDNLDSAILDLHVDGCTTWAASGCTTLDGRLLLVKNRDYHQDHIALQSLASVIPAQGYSYLCLGSAGSPTVFSSGINERGLAVADTHVLSRDIGPGLPRFSLMRQILESHDTTASALDYLRSVYHMGAGTLTLADASGHLAVWESGHERNGWRESTAADEGGSQPSYVVSTNHFVEPGLSAQWVEDEAPILAGNSLARHERVAAALSSCAGRVDITWAQHLMSAHGSLQDAICRHPIDIDGQHLHPGLQSSTISSVIFLPLGHPGQDATEPVLMLANGLPCQSPWELYTIAM
jgi:isopenicillin-N N-acyltransferase like protein